MTLDYDRWGVEAGELILDLGCGSGRHTFEALRRGSHVVSADLDLTALKETAATGALLQAERKALPGARSLCIGAHALRLPFQDGAFDRVIASEVLEHIVHDRQALVEIGRVLKPHGCLVVTVPRFWPERVCWALSRDYHTNPGGHVRIYRAGELRTKLQSAGFELDDAHFAHALHSPYWWLKCLFGVANQSAKLPGLYHRFLVWDLMRRPRMVRTLERTLNPILGKSVILYASKRAASREVGVAA